MEQWSCIRPDNRSQLIEYQELHRRPIVREGVKKMDPEGWRSFTLHMAIPERKKNGSWASSSKKIRVRYDRLPLIVVS